MKQFSMSPIFFHHIFCIDALLSLPLSKKFACVNIKLYYCIFWLCLVATLYFYNLFPSTFTHHCCCWPCKRLLVWIFSLALLFDIQSDFPHQPHWMLVCCTNSEWNSRKHQNWGKIMCFKLFEMQKRLCRMQSFAQHNKKNEHEKKRERNSMP